MGESMAFIVSSQQKEFKIQIRTDSALNPINKALQIK